MEKEAYLLELARYIVLNPVRAGIVENVEQWLWSSYRMTTGLESCPDWFDRDWLLNGFAKRRNLAVRQYMEFVAHGAQQPSPWNMLKQQIFLGSDTFVEQAQSKVAGDLSEIPKIQRRGKPKTLGEYAASAVGRDEAMVSAYKSGGYTLKEIADHYSLHYSTVSRIVKRMRRVTK